MTSLSSGCGKRDAGLLVINKIDKVHPDELLAIIEDYAAQMTFAEIVPISATEGNNFETLMRLVIDQMPEGPQYFPEDQITDHPEYFIVSELVREKVLLLTRDEVPHSVAVVVDSMNGMKMINSYSSNDRR